MAGPHPGSGPRAHPHDPDYLLRHVYTAHRNRLPLPVEVADHLVRIFEEAHLSGDQDIAARLGLKPARLNAFYTDGRNQLLSRVRDRVPGARSGSLTEWEVSGMVADRIRFMLTRYAQWNVEGVPAGADQLDSDLFALARLTGGSIPQSQNRIHELFLEQQQQTEPTNEETFDAQQYLTESLGAI